MPCPPIRDRMALLREGPLIFPNTADVSDSKALLALSEGVPIWRATFRIMSAAAPLSVIRSLEYFVRVPVEEEKETPSRDPVARRLRAYCGELIPRMTISNRGARFKNHNRDDRSYMSQQRS